MPEVYVEATLAGKFKVNLLLNSGARDLEIVVPATLIRKLGVKLSKKTEVIFGGVKYSTKAGLIEAKIRDPETGKERSSLLEIVPLPSSALDCPLLGVVGQEKFRITPDVPAGKVIFK